MTTATPSRPRSDGSAPVRRPVSARRYWVRRTVVLGGVAVGLIGGVVAVSSLVGSSGGPTDEVAGATGESVADPAVTTGEVPSATDGPDVTDVTVVTDVPAGPPTADEPASVYIVGDSDAGTFGPYLQQLLDGTGIVETELNYKVSSGLARPDFFDWPAELARTIPEVDPDIVVATFGGNDAQGLSVADGTFIVDDPVADSAEWTAEYRRRVGEVIDILTADGRTLVWVGIPNDDSAEVTERLAVQNEAVKAEIATRPDVVFVDTWSRFSGRSGGWAEYVIDPRDGQGKDVRADDGFHLNQTGAEILAIDIAQAIRDDLRARGAAI